MNTEQDIILVVDDTPSNLQVLFTCLEKSGYKVLVAQTGEQALQIAEIAAPNLILLDILMPGLDGFTTSLHLKAQVKTRDIPIIFLTALSETANKVKGFEVGGVDYITKPIEQQEVLARIHTHLTLQKMRQHLLAQNQALKQEIDNRLQVESQLQQRTSELEQTLKYRESLRRIQEKIRDSLDESHILQIATKELVEILSIDSCQLELYNTDKKTATIAYECNNGLPKFPGVCRQIDDFPELYQQLFQKISLQLVNTSIARQFVASQRVVGVPPIVATDEGGGVPRLKETVEGGYGEVSSPTRSDYRKVSLSAKNLEFTTHPQNYFTSLVCPIFENHSQSGVIGNLWLQRPSEQVFTELEIKLVQQVANQCAIAIRQARLYKAAQQQVQELEKLNRLKDDFLKTISHELRAPMSSLQLSVETLDKLFQQEYKPKSPLFTKVLSIFHQACQRQKQLVDDLLSLCYIDAKAEVIVNEWIDLQIWIPEIVELFLEQTQLQQQQLHIDLPSELPDLKSDLSTLDRILRELLNNACKYTPSGETITVSAQATTAEIVLLVSNTGVEIPVEEQEHIFGQFYRIPNNDPWQHGGTGLGLTLVNKLIEILNASIEVTSYDNQTTFSLRFLR